MLLRPKSPGNVGSVARAMKNMGFADLIIANPMTYDDPAYFDEEAGRMAWNAAGLLAARQTAPDLATALAPFHLVIGTTSNPPPGTRLLSPREMAAEVVSTLASSPELRTALLLGQEDIGLTREDLSWCRAVCVIPASIDYVSLNLSQAALIFMYELRLAFLGDAGTTPRDDGSPPTGDQLAAFYARLEQLLADIDFFPGTGGPHMMREVRRIFNRAILTERDLAILEGLIHQVRWAIRPGGGS